MKRWQATVAAGLWAVATAALAGGADWERSRYRDWARVVDVVPQYEQVTVVDRDCRDEGGYGRYRHDGLPDRESGRSVGGAIVGGVAGGLLGSQIGRGDGRTAATVVGALTGALIGDRLDNRDRYRPVHEAPGSQAWRRCRDREHREARLVGYNVTYEYDGRRYTRFMTEDPGRRVRVNVSVSPDLR